MQLRGGTVLPDRAAPAAPAPLAKGPAVAPLGEAGARARARELTDASLTDTGWRKYRREFEKYVAFCEQHELSWAPMYNEHVLAYIDERCRAAGNAISAEQWRSQLWNYAERKEKLRAYNTATDGPFWERAYHGLAKAYGKDSDIPNPLDAHVLQLAYDIIKPSIRRDALEYHDWAHVLMSYHLTMRPGEHTGRASKCVAGNFEFSRTRKGTRAIVYRFPRGSTKSERKQGIYGASTKALKRGSTFLGKNRPITIARSMPGSNVLG